MAPERPRCPSPSNTLMPFPGPWASLAFSGVKPKMDRASSAQDVSFLAVGEPNGPAEGREHQSKDLINKVG
eukprot:1148781-Pelagomonas_calceolata.AAC.3